MMVPRYRSTTNHTRAIRTSSQVEGHAAISKATGGPKTPLHLEEGKHRQQREGERELQGAGMMSCDNDDTSVTLDSSSTSLRLDQFDASLSRLPQHLSDLTVIEEPPRRGSLDDITSNSESAAADSSSSRTSTNSNRTLDQVEPPVVQRKGILKPADAVEEKVTCRLQQWIINKNKKAVSFSTVDVRKHTITLGDNPACRFGVPLSLGWDFEDVPSEDVGQFERRRREVRRTELNQLALSSCQRFDALKRCGFEDSQLKKAEKKIAKVQRQRNMTLAMQPLYKVEKLVETAGRGARKVLRRTKSK